MGADRPSPVAEVAEVARPGGKCATQTFLRRFPSQSALVVQAVPAALAMARLAARRLLERFLRLMVVAVGKVLALEPHLEVAVVARCPPGLAAAPEAGLAVAQAQAQALVVCPLTPGLSGEAGVVVVDRPFRTEQTAALQSMVAVAVGQAAGPEHQAVPASMLGAVALAAIQALLLQRGKRQRVAAGAATTIRTVQTVRAAKCGFGLAKEKGAFAPLP